MLIRLFVILAGIVPSLVMADTSVNDPIIQNLNNPSTSTIKLFTPESTDLSLSFLRMIFGSVGNVVHGTSSQLVGEMFSIFNMGVLAITGMLISYTVVMATISSSQDSSPMGNKMSPFVVLRIVVGSSMLVPAFAGYSAIQVATMWFVVQGVGFADTVWKTALTYIENTGGSIMMPESGAYTAAGWQDETTGSTLLSAGESLARAGVAAGNVGIALAGDDIMLGGAVLQAVAQKDSMSKYSEIKGSLLGSSTTIPPTVVGNGAKVGDFFLSAVCAQQAYQTAYNTAVGAPGATLPSSSRYGVSFGSGCPNNYDVCFGDTHASGQAAAATCGAYNWASTSDGASEQFITYSQAATRQIIYDVQSTASDLYTMAYNHLNGSGHAESNKSAANTAVRCPQSDDVGAHHTSTTDFFACEGANVMVTAATDFYVLTKPPRIQASDLGCQGHTAWMAASREQGWISAGNHYRNLVGGANSFCKSRQNLVPLSHKGQYALIPTVKVKAPFPSGETIAAKAYRTVWDATNSVSANYVDVAGQIIDNMQKADQPFQNMSSSAGAESEVSDLDYVASQIFDVLLRHQTNDIPSFRPNAGFAGVGSLNFASTNMMTMINMVMGKLTGMLVYIPSSDSTSSTVEDEAAFKHAPLYLNKPCKAIIESIGTIGTCNPAMGPAGMSGCFNYLKTASKWCLQPQGIGMLSAIAVEEQGGRADPIAMLSAIGQTMINGAVLYWTATISQLFDTMQALATSVTVALVGVGIASGILAGAASLIPVVGGAAGGMVQSVASAGLAAIQIFFDLDKAAMVMYLPIGGAASAFMFVQGIILGVYVPFIPFLLFLFGAIGWLVAVVEAMIAAPLVAMGLTHPEGHDLLGKAEQSVMLFLGIFIRPAAMILGFILSIILAYIAFRLLNLGFLHIIASYLISLPQSYSGAPITLIGSVGLMLVYTFIAMSLVDQVFAMIYLVPEKILRWIGGPADGTAQQIQQLTGAVKQQTQGAAQQAGQGASQAAGTAPQVSAQQGQTPKFDFSSSDKGGSQEGAGDVGEGGGAPGGGGGGAPPVPPVA